MSRRIAFVAAALVAVASLAVSAAGAATSSGNGKKKQAAAKSAHLLIGINAEPQTLYGDPAQAFKQLKNLRTQVLRVNLYWGGTKWAVANTKPTDPTDPGDPAYNWAIYDRLARYAATYHIRVMFSILFTPGWANGGRARTIPPRNPQDLQDFAYAAAERYSGFWTPPPWQENTTLAPSGTPLPLINLWTAWNEPNDPIWLKPQYKRVKGRWVIESAIQYAKICNAIYAGVHSVVISPERGAPPGEQVACGVLNPRGNDAPRSKRPSVDPLSFVTAAKRAGMGPFDAFAHNPYASSGKQPPTFVPKGKAKRRIQLGNLNVLIKRVTRLWGKKPFWITEYGYQTNPPDRTIFGTSWKNQAKWLRQAVLMMRKNPRVSIFIWYLLQDEPNLGGWQSGLETITGRHKPSWNVFKRLPRG